MKVLIWFLGLFVFSLITTSVKHAGITLGGIPTALLAAAILGLTKIICNIYEETKAGKANKKTMQQSPQPQPSSVGKSTENFQALQSKRSKLLKEVKTDFYDFASIIKTTATWDHCCPKCNFRYSLSIYSNKKNDYKKYGSPIRQCEHCGTLYIDKQYQELEINGYTLSDKFLFFAKFNVSLLITLLFGIIFSIISFLFINNIIVSSVSVSIVVFSIIAIIFDSRTYYDFISKIVKAREESKARLNRPEYAGALKQLGYNIPSKYSIEHQNNDAKTNTLAKSSEAEFNSFHNDLINIPTDDYQKQCVEKIIEKNDVTKQSVDTVIEKSIVTDNQLKTIDTLEKDRADCLVLKEELKKFPVAKIKQWHADGKITDEQYKAAVRKYNSIKNEIKDIQERINFIESLNNTNV